MYSSGTEEEYTELTQLLEDISVYQRDMQASMLKEKENKKQKEQTSKKLGEDMRLSAMKTFSRKYNFLHSISSNSKLCREKATTAV